VNVETLKNLDQGTLQAILDFSKLRDQIFADREHFAQQMAPVHDRLHQQHRRIIELEHQLKSKSGGATSDASTDSMGDTATDPMTGSVVDAETNDDGSGGAETNDGSGGADTNDGIGDGGRDSERDEEQMKRIEGD
jgi:hypothetical protein